MNFIYADKQDMERLLPLLFEILHENMSKIAPTGNNYETDFRQWLECVAPAMCKEARKIVLMYDNNALAGYFQYYTNGDMFMMEEIQFREKYHGSGLFREFYRWLVHELPDTIEYVEAYSNKSNFKSQAVLEHLGLSRIGENKNGITFHYRGGYKTLADKYR